MIERVTKSEGSVTGTTPLSTLSVQPATPRLDRATVARFVVDDFDLAENELAALVDPNVRHALEDELREVVDFPKAAAEAVERWRARRGN